MKEIAITSVELLLNQLNTYNETDFFRGHSSIDYKLVPSIGRLYPKHPEILSQFERDIFNDFKLKYSLFTETRPQNDFDLLFLAQHYGLPTRLLDCNHAVNPIFFSIL